MSTPTLSPCEVYDGSDPESTRRLYAELDSRGPLGRLATALFRASKCSGRAKDYTRRFKGEAYARKQWSMGVVCELLQAEPTLVPAWGWKRDPKQEHYPWVLYVETPAGQVSFHNRERGRGPDYAGEWDGVAGAGPHRVIVLAQAVLTGSVSLFSASNEGEKTDTPGHGLVHGTPGPCLGQPDLFEVDKTYEPAPLFRSEPPPA